MRPLAFTLKEAPAERVDCSPLTPDALAGKSVKEVAELALWCGNRQRHLSELFLLRGDDPNHLVVENSSDRLEKIGARMTHGQINIRGEAGSYLGLQMQGGEIRVHGNAGAFAACQMRRGIIHIDGSAGDFLGAPLPGEMQGMRGGIVMVSGNVGERCGDRMRRGQILIEGDVGAFCASRMVAGTIAVLGNCGNNLGFAMRRGTVLLRAQPKEMLATFNDCGEHELSFLRLLFKSWENLPTRFAQFAPPPRVARWMGDLGNLGKGEILISSNP